MVKVGQFSSNAIAVATTCIIVTDLIAIVALVFFMYRVTSTRILDAATLQSVTTDTATRKKARQREPPFFVSHWIVLEPVQSKERAITRVEMQKKGCESVCMRQNNLPGDCHERYQRK
jgi:hypothetical protein